MTRLSAFAFAAACCLFPLPARPQVEIRDAYTDKSRHLPGETATITVILKNLGASSWSGDVVVELYRLEAKFPTLTQSVTPPIPPGLEAAVPLTWETPPVDFAGYYLWVTTNPPPTNSAATAIDVSSRWTRYPRYGFITEFFHGAGGSDWGAGIIPNNATGVAISRDLSAKLIEPLARDYHLNALQFYDWMFRHEFVVDYASPGKLREPWVDWRNKNIYPSVLRDLIEVAHRNRVAALPYFAAYQVQFDISSSGMLQPLPSDFYDWGLYGTTAGNCLRTNNACGASSGATLCWPGSPCAWAAREIFALMDPLNLDWQAHMIDQFELALKEFDFDGIHIDNLGNVAGGTGGGYYNVDGNSVDMAHGFSPLINLTKDFLQDIAADPEQKFCGGKAVTFNLVDGAPGAWGYEDMVLDSQVDFLYSEIWANGETYLALQNFVRDARTRSRGKAMVLAAYVNRNGSGYFNDHSVLLADACIFASGAFHIELGDGTIDYGSRMLGNEFFPNRDLRMYHTLKAAMKEYYNFITAYEELLFDPGLGYGDGGGQWIEIVSPPAVGVSGYGEGGKVWFLSRRNAKYEVLHLINLQDNDDDWRDFANAPTPLVAHTVKLRWGPQATAKQIHLASPDKNHGKTESLTPTMSPGVDLTGDNRGTYVSFTVPGLKYWNMIFIERDVTTPPGGVYEAEEAVRTKVNVVTGGGLSGPGYVDGFDDFSEGVSFYITCPVDADYDLDFTFKNPGTSDARRSIFIDGVGPHRGGKDAHRLAFPPAASWTSQKLTAHLKAGPHQVVVAFINHAGFPDSGAIALDSLKVGLPPNGLKAEYFRREDLTRLELTKVDPNVDFGAGGTVSPWSVPYVDAVGTDVHDSLSVRWSGFVKPPVTDTYTFTVASDDGARLWVDGRLLIDHWDPNHDASTPMSQTMPLRGNTLYPIRMEYHEHTGDQVARLLWNRPAQPMQAIPQSSLFLPGDAAGVSTILFQRGDVNADGDTNLTDALAIAAATQGKPLFCHAAADVDDDGVLDLLDAILVLKHLFMGCEPPPPPFPGCGVDPTGDHLSCEVTACL